MCKIRGVDQNHTSSKNCLNCILDKCCFFSPTVLVSVGAKIGREFLVIILVGVLILVLLVLVGRAATFYLEGSGSVSERIIVVLLIFFD